MTKALATALVFAEKGIHCFPQDRNKRPLIKEWPQKATCDAEQLKRWGESFPTANFACATGRLSRIVVIDVDVKNGQPGHESLGRWEAERGKLDTFRVRTPSGGWHFYLATTGELEVRTGPLRDYPGIEVKGEGGCVTIPGCLYANGAEYVAETEMVLAELLPQSFLVEGHGNGSGHGAKAEHTRDGCIEQGQRNTTLTARAGKLRGVGASAAAILAELREVNEARCNPPLSDSEVKEIAESVSRYPDGRSRRGRSSGWVSRTSWTSPLSSMSSSPTCPWGRW